MEGESGIDDRATQCTDSELVDRVLNGDASAFSGLVERHQNAEAVGISASAVRSRLHYGRERLRELMLPVAEEVFAQERRTSRFTKAVMAALPLVIPRPSAAVIILGLTIKELLMSVGGIAVTAGLLGLIWTREASLETQNLQNRGRAVRLASAEQRAALQVALAAETEAGPKARGKKMKLDIEAEESGGDIVGCLRPALRVAGVDWSC